MYVPLLKSERATSILVALSDFNKGTYAPAKPSEHVQMNDNINNVNLWNSLSFSYTFKSRCLQFYGNWE